MIKNPPASAGDARDMGSIPGSERSPGEGEGSPRQYSCLENPMDRGALAGYSLWSRKESDMTEAVLARSAYGILVPLPGIEPGSIAVKA